MRSTTFTATPGVDCVATSIRTSCIASTVTRLIWSACSELPTGTSLLRESAGVG